MGRAQGSRAQMNVAFESVYGTAPVSGFRTMPFASSTLGAMQPLIENELLGFGRDPVPPIKDAVTADGMVSVPIDLENLGVWLRAAFGSAVVAGVAAASGSIAFSAQPTANSTVTINGTVFTFVASGATGNQVNIGANLAATMTALATALNASVVPGVAAATYTGAAAALNILHDTPGAAGNSFTLAASTSPVSNGTVSGATLTGGTSTHTFQSGSDALPSLAIELGYPEVPHFGMNTGCKVDRLRWEMQRTGQLRMDVDMVAQGEDTFASTQAGTPTAFALQRFGQFNGSILRNGSALAEIVSAEFVYSNNLDRVETIRADGKIDGADPTIASLSGRIVARFSDTVLLSQAIAGGPCELVSRYSLGANAQFEFTAHAVYLPRPKIEVSGPAGIEVTFEFQGARAVSPARMATAVLRNQIAVY